MRATSYDAFSTDNSTLTTGELPDPTVGPGNVLVEVKAAGVNPVDWKIMTGDLTGLLDAVFPVVPGWDVAGVVRAVGPDTPSSPKVTRSTPTPARRSSAVAPSPNSSPYPPSHWH